MFYLFLGALDGDASLVLLPLRPFLAHHAVDARGRALTGGVTESFVVDAAGPREAQVIPEHLGGKQLKSSLPATEFDNQEIHIELHGRTINKIQKFVTRY